MEGGGVVRVRSNIISSAYALGWCKTLFAGPMSTIELFLRVGLLFNMYISFTYYLFFRLIFFQFILLSNLVIPFFSDLRSTNAYRELLFGFTQAIAFPAKRKGFHNDGLKLRLISPLSH